MIRGKGSVRFVSVEWGIQWERSQRAVYGTTNAQVRQ